MSYKHIFFTGLLLVFVITLLWFLKPTPSPPKGKDLPFRRCMNIGNALEAPRGTPWDVQMDKRYFDIIKAAGFDSVRLPVRFSDYAIGNPGYHLDPDFMSEVDGYVDYALELGLTVILDLHHFVELMEEPGKYREGFLTIWEQLSFRYRNYPPQLIFELLNEPQKNLEGETWNRLLSEAVDLIRRDNPDRFLIIGPDRYNSLHRLEELRLPDDKNIIVSIHYYSPTDFAFQGDPYHEGYEELADISWGKPEEKKRLQEDFRKASDWAKANDRLIFLGEFGVNRNAPHKSRELWIKEVRKQAEKMGFIWGYWEFCSNFGIYNRNTNLWDRRLLRALMN